MPSDEDPQLTQQIVDAIRGGNREEWNALLERVGGKVYVYIHNRMGRLREIMTPEDVLQEVFTKAHDAFDDFVGGESGSLSRWLIAVAENQIRRLRRHHFDVQKRDPDREVPLQARSMDAGSPEPAASGPTPSSVVARDERVRRVADAVAGLEPEARELVLQHVYEERPIDHIATDLGVPRTTLNHRLKRTLAQLKAELGPQQA